MLLLLILTLRAVAAPTEPAEVVRQFEQAWKQSRSWKDIQVYFSGDTTGLLEQLTPDQQSMTYALTRPATREFETANPKIEVKVEGSWATVRVDRVQKVGPDQYQYSRTYDLHLEKGEWKVDFRDALQVDD